ncbi:MAG: hydrogenase iron-sulfur subunit [Proteobacteria bacterium]|nr:hydrogenase iron-sulfur subunit [Pseudomonadota bacterium]MBU1387365.1 hydrogenase iron-sulfur subunit [Pseudomonadota bacterium]MBU1541650.1 hydrogenase iron-sulfur subunit [Pseudomonadota bacterium]MBU2482116.1 hydrogenase iron-sulfur subunit [Pseudomonadota bacterium]
MNTEIMKFKHLEKWQSTLANCIRCGYCFEHCPLYKHTGWETDAPRAKIITAFGLLSKEIEPTRAAAHKLFSCFYCKRCEAACSSGVLLTEIFTDAKKDLLELGLCGPGTTSTTRTSCAKCLVCLAACPHEARSFDGKNIVTDPSRCQACGICIEVCPAGAATIENTFGTGRNELIDKAADFLASHKAAKAIVFACNWSYFPELQASTLPESEMTDKQYKILVNMCGGRLEPQLLMAPFLNNAWGVLAACCPDDDCQHGGNLRARKIIANLKNTFKTLEIDPDRIQMVQIPAGDKTLFQAEIDTFIARINTMGPIR